MTDELTMFGKAMNQTEPMVWYVAPICIYETHPEGLTPWYLWHVHFDEELEERLENRIESASVFATKELARDDAPTSVSSVRTSPEHALSVRAASTPAETSPRRSVFIDGTPKQDTCRAEIGQKSRQSDPPPPRSLSRRS